MDSEENKRLQTLAEYLLACPSLGTKGGRENIISTLPSAVKNNITFHSQITPKQEIDLLVRTCLNYKDGLTDLVERLQYFDSETIQFARLQDYFLEQQKYFEEFQTNTINYVPHNPVLNNLTAPDYGRFIMRENAFHYLVEALTARSAVVLITSMGGMGKTSLAREIAGRCLDLGGTNYSEEFALKFEGVVWITDKDNPGNTNLNTVLNTIAQVLDYPGITRLELDQKQKEVGSLLKSKKVLVVIDNFETVRDSKLLDWLQRLPEPSKALITSRIYLRAFRNNTFVYDLEGMTNEEAIELVKQRLVQINRRDLDGDVRQYTPLFEAVGGNPKAIVIALGYLQHKRQSLNRIIAELKAATGNMSEIFDDLFKRCWEELLTLETKQIIFSMLFFTESVGEEALAATAGVTPDVFNRAVDLLADLSLLEVIEESHNDLTFPFRYTLHPLVRAFIQSKSQEYADFEKDARTRWANWYLKYVEEVGYCWDDLSKLNRLDFEQENVYGLMEWFHKNQDYEKTLEISKAISYYYYVRGLWSRLPRLHELQIEAARKRKDGYEEASATAGLIQLLSKQSNPKEVQKYLGKLLELIQIYTNTASFELYYNMEYALALYWQLVNQLELAQQAWERIITRADQLLGSEEDEYKRKDLLHRWVSASHGLANLLRQQGELEKARKHLKGASRKAQEIEYKRGIINTQVSLAQLNIEQRILDGVEEELRACELDAIEVQNRETLSLILRLQARIYAINRESNQARKILEQARTLSERLGMLKEVELIDQEIMQLNEEVTPVGNSKQMSTRQGQGWLTLEQFHEGIIQLFKLGKIGLATDIDGTLSRIADTPQKAQISERNRNALQSLKDNNLFEIIAVVTGRQAMEARKLVNIPELLYMGNHGMEILEPGATEATLVKAAAHYQPLISTVLVKVQEAVNIHKNSTNMPGVQTEKAHDWWTNLIFENKGITASIHYRLSPYPDLAHEHILEEVEKSIEGTGLRISEGRMVVEIRPPVTVNKGTALVELAREHQLAGMIFMGDDLTDADGFKAIHDLKDVTIISSNSDNDKESHVFMGIGIGVKSSEMPRAVRDNADFLVEGVSGVEDFLSWLSSNS